MATLLYFLLLISTTIGALSAECSPFAAPPNRSNCTKPKWSQQGITVAGDGTEGKSTTKLGHPFCIFLDQNDDLLVCDFGNHRVQKFQSGSNIGTTICGALNNTGFYPGDVFVDSDSNLFIADYYNKRALKLFPNSSDSKIIDTKNSYPGSIYPDKQGNIFVLQLVDEGYGSPWQLMKYSIETGEKTRFAIELTNPSGLFVDECGTAYTANARGTNDGTIQKIVNARDPKGIVLADGLKEPTDVTLDRYGNVYFVERGESRIRRINARDGTVETVVDKQGVLVFGTQYWNDPRNVAFDSKHNLYVADFKNFRVQKFLFEGGDLFC
ncbi:unnamed protein product [Adineta steineri]|uniref:Uncharacterized protein n=1 Tax=Adineta steineri TaxID=433720 RepID=A0A818J4P5_9BILA|nr:unnamed protein product [Adineta steineri]CAF3535529.1 unnamed protein product [Adineta steineri]